MKDVDIKPEWLEPFHKGFRRAVQHKVYSSQKKYFVTYFAPGGEALRKLDAVTKYLEKHPHLQLTVENFHFQRQLIYKEPEETFTEIIVPKSKDEEANESNEMQSPVLSKAKKHKTPEKLNTEDKSRDTSAEHKNTSTEAKATPPHGKSTDNLATIKSPNNVVKTSNIQGKCKSPNSLVIKNKSPSTGAKSKSPDRARVKLKSPGSDVKQKIISPRRRVNDSTSKDKISCSGVAENSEAVKRPRGRPKKRSDDTMMSPRMSSSSPSPSTPKRKTSVLSASPVHATIQPGLLSNSNTSVDEVQLNLSESKLKQTSVKPLKRKIKRPSLSVKTDSSSAVVTDNTTVVRKRGRPKKSPEVGKDITKRSKSAGGSPGKASCGEKISEKGAMNVPAENCLKIDDRVIDRQACENEIDKAKRDASRTKVKHCPTKNSGPGTEIKSPENKSQTGGFEAGVHVVSHSTKSPGKTTINRYIKKPLTKATEKERVIGGKVASPSRAKKSLKSKMKKVGAETSKKTKLKSNCVNKMSDNQKDSDVSKNDQSTFLLSSLPSYFDDPNQINKNLYTPPVDLGTSFSDTMAPIPSEIDYQSIVDSGGSLHGDASMTPRNCSMDIQYQTPIGPRVVAEFAQKNLSPSAGISCAEVETRYTSSDGVASIFSPNCVTPSHGTFTMSESTSPENERKTAIEHSVQKPTKKQYISKVILSKKTITIPAKIRGIKSTLRLLERKHGMNLTPSISLIKFDNVLLSSLSGGTFLDSGDSNCSSGSGKVFTEGQNTASNTQRTGFQDAAQGQGESTTMDVILSTCEEIQCTTESTTKFKKSVNWNTTSSSRDASFDGEQTFITVDEQGYASDRLFKDKRLNSADEGPSMSKGTAVIYKKKQNASSFGKKVDLNDGEEDGNNGNKSLALSATAVLGEGLNQPPKTQATLELRKQSTVDVDLNEENFEPDYEDSHSNSGRTRSSNDEGDPEEEDDDNSSSEEDHVDPSGQDVLLDHKLDKDYLLDKFLDGTLLKFQDPDLKSPSLQGPIKDDGSRETGNQGMVKGPNLAGPLVPGIGAVVEGNVKTCADTKVINNESILKTASDMDILQQKSIKTGKQSKVQESQNILKTKSTVESRSSHSERNDNNQCNDGAELSECSAAAPSSNSAICNTSIEQSMMGNPSNEPPTKPSETLSEVTKEIDTPGKSSDGVKTVKKTKLVIQKGDIDEDGYITRITASGKRRFKVKKMVRKKAVVTPVMTPSASKMAIEMNTLEDIIGKAIASSDDNDLTLMQRSQAVNKSDQSLKRNRKDDEVTVAITEASVDSMVESSKPPQIVTESENAKTDTSVEHYGDKNRAETLQAQSLGESSQSLKVNTDTAAAADSLIKDDLNSKQGSVEGKSAKNSPYFGKGPTADDPQRELGSVTQQSETPVKPPDCENAQSELPGGEEEEKQVVENVVSNIGDNSAVERNTVAEDEKVEDVVAERNISDNSAVSRNTIVEEENVEDAVAERNISDNSEGSRNAIATDEKVNHSVVLKETSALCGEGTSIGSDGLQPDEKSLQTLPTNSESKKKPVIESLNESQSKVNVNTSVDRKDSGQCQIVEKEAGKSTKSSKNQSEAKGPSHTSSRIIGNKRRGSSESTSKKSDKITKEKNEKHGELEKKSKEKAKKIEESTKEKKHKKPHSTKDPLLEKTHSIEKEIEGKKHVKQRESTKLKGTDQVGKIHKVGKTKTLPAEKQSNDVPNIEMDFDVVKNLKHVKESGKFFEAMEREKTEPKKKVARRSSREDKCGKIQEKGGKSHTAAAVQSRRSSGEKVEHERRTSDKIQMDKLKGLEVKGVNEEKEKSKDSSNEQLEMKVVNKEKEKRKDSCKEQFEMKVVNKEKEKSRDSCKEQSKIHDRKWVGSEKYEGKPNTTEGSDHGTKKRKLKVKGRQTAEIENSNKDEKETNMKTSTNARAEPSSETSSSDPVTTSVIQSVSKPGKVSSGFLYNQLDCKPEDLRPESSPRRTPIKMGTLYCVPSSDEESGHDQSFTVDETLGEGETGIKIDFSALKGLKITMGAGRSVEVNRNKGMSTTRTISFQNWMVDDQTAAVVNKIVEEIKLDMSKYEQKANNGIKIDHSLFASAMSSAVAVEKVSTTVAPQKVEILGRDERDEVRSPKVATVQPVKDISNIAIVSSSNQQVVRPNYQVGTDSRHQSRTLPPHRQTNVETAPQIMNRRMTDPQISNNTMEAPVAPQENATLLESALPNTVRGGQATEKEPAVSSGVNVSLAISHVHSRPTSSLPRRQGPSVTRESAALSSVVPVASANSSSSELPPSILKSDTKVQMSSSASNVRIKRPTVSAPTEPTEIAQTATGTVTPESVKEPPPIHRIISSFSTPVQSSTPSHPAPQQEVKVAVVPKSAMFNMKRTSSGNGTPPIRTFQMTGIDGKLKTYKVHKMKRLGRPNQQTNEQEDQEMPHNVSDESTGATNESVETPSQPVQSCERPTAATTESTDKTPQPVQKQKSLTVKNESMETSTRPVTSQTLPAVSPKDPRIRKNSATAAVAVTDKNQCGADFFESEGGFSPDSESELVESMQKAMSEYFELEDKKASSSGMCETRNVDGLPETTTEEAKPVKGSTKTMGRSDTSQKLQKRKSSEVAGGREPKQRFEMDVKQEVKKEQVDKPQLKEIPVAWIKKEKKDPGWYSGVIDDDDLTEIDGSERTVKHDEEETCLNALEVCVSDGDYNRLGHIFIDFVKNRLMNSPTYKKKFEEAFFKDIEMVSGRFMSFLDGIEQALQQSGETRPLCDVSMVRSPLSSLSLALMTRTLHECLWSHTYKILYALEQRKTDDANQAANKFMTSTERACVALACHLESNMLDKAIELLETADVDWLSIKKMTSADIIKARRSRLSLLWSLLRKLLEKTTLCKRDSKSFVQRETEKYMTSALKVLKSILNTYEEDVKMLPDYHSVIDVNMQYNRMLSITMRLNQTPLLLLLYNLQFSLPYVHVARYQQRSIIFYLKESFDSEEIVNEAVKIAHHGIECGLYPRQEAVRIGGSRMLLWPDLTQIEMYLLVVDHLCTMCNSLARYAREGREVTIRSCVLTVLFEKRSTADKDLDSIFQKPENIYNEVLSGRNRFIRMMAEIFKPPIEVWKCSQHQVSIDYEKLSIPMEHIWYTKLKKEVIPPWQSESLKSQLGDTKGGSLKLADFVQRLVSRDLCMGTSSALNPSTASNSPQSSIATSPGHWNTPPESNPSGSASTECSQNVRSRQYMVNSTAAATSVAPNIFDYAQQERDNVREESASHNCNYYDRYSSQYNADAVMDPKASISGVSQVHNSEAFLEGYGRRTKDEPLHQQLDNTIKQTSSVDNINSLFQGNTEHFGRSNFMQDKPEVSGFMHHNSEKRPHTVQQDSWHDQKNRQNQDKVGSSRFQSSDRNQTLQQMPQSNRKHSDLKSEPSSSGPQPQSGFSSSHPYGFDSYPSENQESIPPNHFHHGRGRRPYKKKFRQSPSFPHRGGRHRPFTQSRPYPEHSSTASGPADHQTRAGGDPASDQNSPVLSDFSRQPLPTPLFPAESSPLEEKGPDDKSYGYPVNIAPSRSETAFPPAEQEHPTLVQPLMGLPPPQNNPAEENAKTKLLQSIKESVGQRLAYMIQNKQLKGNQSICEMEENLTMQFFNRSVSRELRRNPLMTFNDHLFNQLIDFLAWKLH